SVSAPAPRGVPAPLSDAEIAAFSYEQAMKEWTSRKKASVKPDLDATTRQRLEEEAEKCRLRMQAAREEVR
ncbi:MAG: hypothetical protein H7X97_06380, partial [Opitutaceae bacterium]|nr:hypothetical protein [Verrucomicrobiales bacterium]